MKSCFDGKRICGSNWQDSKFLMIDPVTLAVRCALDLAKYNVFTPWEFIVFKERVYVSNVTYPMVTELYLNTDPGECNLTLGKNINFFEEGYTKLTDGAFGLYIDQTRNRLYVLVGMLEGKYLMGFVEVDMDTFKIQRDIRLPAGTTVFPVEGTDSVLLPSYYYGKVYEVSLSTMKLLRTIDAEPGIFSMEFDRKRNMIYASSRAAGVLLVIDYESGRTIKRVPIGAKPEPLYFDRNEDCLYVGSKLGILKISLDQFLNS
jgi:hypothetical protein